MNNFTIFVVGLIVTLITGMGVITSEVFLGYKKSLLFKIENKPVIPKTNPSLDNGYSTN